MKYITNHFAQIFKDEIGSTRYIKETEIDNNVVEIAALKEMPKTNRGLPKAEGWLGSWSSGGCTKDSYARGLCELVATKPITDDNDRVVMIEAAWEPVK
jgi:hypothetical protein